MRPHVLLLALSVFAAVGLLTACDDPTLTAPAPGVAGSAAAMERCAFSINDQQVLAEIDRLKGMVDALEADDALNRGQANALRSHLETAREHIEDEQYCAARAQLRAFREQLGNFVEDGVLTEDQVADLVEIVNRILNDVPPELLVDATLAPVTPTIAGLHGGAPRPLARFINADGRTLDFVENELYLMTEDAAVLDAFVARWNGTVLATLDFSRLGVAHVPPVYLVRIDPSGAETEGLAEKWGESAGLHGENRLSSEAALQLIAAALEEAVDEGLTVGVNPVLGSGGFADRTTAEAEAAAAADPPITYTPNAFEWPYMNRSRPPHFISPQNIGTAEAWRVLDAMGRLSNRVRFGVADGGFIPNQDFPAVRTIVPSGALRIPNPDPTNCGGEPRPECTWHGTHVTMAGMARADNEFGAAGPAGPVAELIMLQSPSTDFFAIFEFILGSIPIAFAERPRIINISAGVAMPTELCLLVIIGLPVCEALHAITDGLRSAGILVVASAGNEGRNVDQTKVFGFWPFEFVEEADLFIPCELNSVLCVGGMNWNATTKHPQSNWGSDVGSRNTVRMFGPYELWSVADAEAADEAHADPDERAGIVRGTSFAAPYVAGVAALVWAGNPALDATQVEQILMGTAHTGSGDSRVPRWVNAIRAVQQAVGGNTPPFVRIIDPSEGAALERGVGTTFRAEVEDLEGDPLDVTWRSEPDGRVLATTAIADLNLDLPLGPNTLSVSAFDGTFTTTRTVDIEVVRAPVTATVIEPFDRACFAPGEPVGFLAAGRDPNNLPSMRLVDEEVHWSAWRRVPLGDPRPDPFDFGTGTSTTHQFPEQAEYRIWVRVEDESGDVWGQSPEITVVIDEGCAGPSVRITEPPTDRTALIEGTDPETGMFFADVELRGEAFDELDGSLTGASLVWTTDRTELQPAELGTGESLTVRLLSPELCGTGAHEVRLTATGATGERSAIRRISVHGVC